MAGAAARPVEGEENLIPADLLAKLLSLIGTSTTPGMETEGTFALMNGAPWAFAVTTVHLVAGVPAGETEETLPRQIHGLQITEALLNQIGQNHLMENLDLAAEPQPGLASLALTDGDGAPIGYAVWMPSRPGANILRRVALPLSLALLGASAIAAVMSSFTVRAARQIEDALASAQAADRSKTEFLSNVSHELRTPMNGIIGVAQLLTLTGLDDEQKGLVEVLNSSAQVQMSLISDLLDLSRIESGNLQLCTEAFVPAEAIRETTDLIRPAAAQKDLTLDLDCSGLDSVCVMGDARAFRQIMTNLIGNAVKFTRSGQVAVKADVARNADRAALAITVTDTGPGIAPEHQRSILHPLLPGGRDADARSGGHRPRAVHKQVARRNDGRHHRPRKQPRCGRGLHVPRRSSPRRDAAV